MSDALKAMTIPEFESYLVHLKDQENEWMAKSNYAMLHLMDSLDGVSIFMRYAEELLDILEHEMYVFKGVPAGVIPDKELAEVMNITAMKMLAISSSLNGFTAVTRNHGA